MLDRTAAQVPGRSPDGIGAARPSGSRRRPLLVCAVLVVALHLAFLDAVDDRAGTSPDVGAPPMSVRSIAPPPEPETAIAVEIAAAASPPPAAPPPAAPPPPLGPRLQPPQRAPQPSPLQPSVSAIPIEASASSAGAQQLASANLAEPSPVGAADRPSASLADVEGAPPPVYRTRLPPAATIHYEVRRGGLRGEGEIRWRPRDDGYRLVLEAKIANLTLLLQTSEGVIDANGLAPVRFVDQRPRRSAQAANFVRDAGRITFSGAGVESPLLDGSQDRLSWMVQLAGIAAAEPQLLGEGGQITMAVVGARGDTGIWVLRSAGHEDVETAHGTVRAVKLVRQGRSAHDTTAEIWLDPERSYLPARATLRNNAGTSEYDLLLQRIDPAP